MGIQGFAERARHELVATGETVRKRNVDSYDELTPQEAHIARLAADGGTNPEIGAQLFISPRTVEWHLKKVFTKLGITSRRELRAALPRHASFDDVRLASARRDPRHPEEREHRHEIVVRLDALGIGLPVGHEDHAVGEDVVGHDAAVGVVGRPGCGRSGGCRAAG